MKSVCLLELTSIQKMEKISQYWWLRVPATDLATYAVNILKCVLQSCFVLQIVQQGSIVMMFQKTDPDRIASLNLINQSFGGEKDLRFPFSDPMQSTVVSYLFSLALSI